MPNLATARAQRFSAYIERLATALGHRERHDPLRAYVTGLCLPGNRKGIEPMAARVDPRHVRTRHQSIHHFAANAPWDDAAVLRVARDTVLAALERHGPLAAWIVDDTGIPKKGRHSAGVVRQYCGVLGEQENCQVAVRTSLARDLASVPAAYRLHLPETWTHDRHRRRAAGGPPGPVVADAGYGVVTAFREQLTAWGIPYVGGISGETTGWPPGRAPRPPKPYGGRGRPPSVVRRTARQRRAGGHAA
jgi:SRSO17 transposase